ncbi:phosphoglycerate dehydrogenase [Aestuariirhabdus sp. Z084]|uniref:phosphoglycerate dehydrogenase n=1 Tax=Aestuariirhabdus haliotis TaxID=2918751 RepID=UPI00201B4266|nr:phosphoglycerate dehydrogenase [Aestuariirhabdus haliotis]MCL6415482.1 phosphoglycerate dehydrogenase [Aestuariirhabdus haliotis]MCL6419313.1 phosphoglycerate dehydrogenase [Aestuariirhabdus haliotis]
MYKIRTYNQISTCGLERFSRAHYEVASEITHPDAYLLRSQNLHGDELPDSLQAIARAGAGVNNVPVEHCSRQGVVVFNTPGANANAVKELVLTGLLLSSRGVSEGLAFVQGLDAGQSAEQMSTYLEGQKKRFAGTEIAGKTLGVVGLGAIGSMVANMALTLGMKVVGYDPAISIEAAWRLSSKVGKMDNLHSLLACSDYVTLHVPSLEATHHLINPDSLSSAKPGLKLLNFAREEIVDPGAILPALAAGKLSAYVADFPTPDLLGKEGVLLLPHIGASTQEAEENCALMAADQLIDYLEHGNIRNSVNFPNISMDRVGGRRITFSNHNVSGVLGDVLSMLADHKVNVLDMLNKSRDALAYNIVDVEGEVTKELLQGLTGIEHVIKIRVV